MRCFLDELNFYRIYSFVCALILLFHLTERRIRPDFCFIVYIQKIYLIINCTDENFILAIHVHKKYINLNF